MEIIYLGNRREEISTDTLFACGKLSGEIILFHRFGVRLWKSCGKVLDLYGVEK